MAQTKLNPSVIFETSWEVCNKVGGIHTVLATKALTVTKELGERYITIGPDFSQDSEVSEFVEDPMLMKTWRQTLYNDGIRVIVADGSHEKYVDTILNTITESAKVRGSGIASRTHEYVATKMRERKAVIALAGVWCISLLFRRNSCCNDE